MTCKIWFHGIVGFEAKWGVVGWTRWLDTHYTVMTNTTPRGAKHFSIILTLKKAMTGNKIGKLKGCCHPFPLWHFGLKIKKSQYLLLPLPFLVTPRQILQFHRKNAIFLSTTFSARPCSAVYYVKVKERVHWLGGYCPIHPPWKIPSKGRRKYKCQTIVEAGCMSRSSRIANKGSACRSLRSGSLDLLEVISSVRVFVSLYFITCPSIWQ